MEKKENKRILLGNEAIVYGALEAKVRFISTYPGTPVSEIGDTFYKLAKDFSYYFEYSENEMVALQSAIGASFANVRSMAVMKNFGLNVCSDSLAPFCYTGAKGPTVIVVGDDPGCFSSAESEQNSRGYSCIAHIPTLEPSDAKECYEYTKTAFNISENYKIPVMVRLTTRVAHQRMPVDVGEINKDAILGKFVKGNNSLITMPPQVLAMHQKLLEKIIKIRGEYSEDSDLNRVENGNSQSTIGIITSGISYSYVQEALKEMGIKIPILKLGFFYPLPVKKIAHFLKKFEKVLVVEELEPYLEKEIKEVCYGENIKTKVFGKSLLPEVGELSTEHVVFALSELAGKMSLFTNTVNVKTVKHIPRFCSGKTGACPYWKLYSAIKEVVPKDAIFGGDIGCYMMAALPPHNLYDYLLNMGSSIGIAHGIKKVSSQKVVAFMGDGTFFHSGISSIINCVYNKSNPLVIIMDNEITAMTGHQPNPGSEVKIEEILKAIGVKNIRVLDEEAQYDELKKTIKEFLNKDSISVIVAKKICWLLAARKN